MDLERLRADTPGCAERIHLNNAGASLMPEPVIRAIQDHIALEARIGGYEAAEARAPAIADAYRSVAALVGARPENIAFTGSATASYVQALSAIPFQSGDVMLTSQNDYASNQIQLLSLQRRLGIRVLRAPDHKEGGVDVDAMRDAVHRHRPRLVSVTHVPTNSGLVQDVASIGAICRDAGVIYLVDACQSVGQMTVDVQTIQCDFLSATSRKFLRGPRGSGFLYVSDRVLEDGLEPLFIDMRGADWVEADRYRPAAGARRFETWEFAWALVLGTGEAARYAQAIGLEAIRARARALAGRLRDGLAAIRGVRVRDRGRELCAIVSASIDGRDPSDLANALRARGINTNAQGRTSAVLDFAAKGIAATLRMAPHYFNTEAEIDRALAAIEDLVSPRSGYNPTP
ncbi:MAG TPA: aminotransferase class V-fold PLP-dependent enzyme [Vicinamibacterales bacterium]|nr:aminotransferase class V-fold PLP-dependent enzyme [Vicinamibacterales bacterium]